MSTAPDSALEVRHDHAAHRYELLVDGRVVGFAEYVDNGDRRTFVYTEIDPDRRGGGLGQHLVEAALDDTRDHGLTPLPQCSFVAAVMRSHPQTPSPSRDRSESGWL